MSETFTETLAGSAAFTICFVVAFIVLTTYIKFINKKDPKLTTAGVISVTKVLAGDAPVDVRLQDGETIRGAKIRQFEISDYLPYSFRDMLVIEFEQGGFTMLRPDRIQRIDLPNCKEVVLSVELEPNRG